MTNHQNQPKTDTAALRGIAGLPAPAICVPLVARTETEARDQLKVLTALKPDLIEIRLDYFEDLTAAATTSLLQTLAEAAEPVPLLATFRRAEEGGVRPLDEATRVAILQAALDSGRIGWLDVEFRTTPQMRDELLNAARTAGVGTLISYHDFEKTPSLEELRTLLRQLGEPPADILKLAVQPREPLDTLNLLTASHEATTGWLDRPLAIMAMGGLGSFTRLAGPFFGSALTFAVGTQSSAPGQLKIDIVEQLWQNWHVR